MEVIILQGDDWEGLFVDGILIQQGHEINRIHLLESAERYGFKSSDIRVLYINEEDEEYLYQCGYFPAKLKELSGNY